MFLGPVLLFLIFGFAYFGAGNAFVGIALIALGAAWPFLYIYADRLKRSRARRTHAI